MPDNKNNKKIVAIGGGTGLFTLLSGLKEYTENLTAIVTITDSGGCSGILRDELGFLPMGDIRKCLIALSESKELMYKFFNYRFEKGSLSGRSMGNLLMAALTDINQGNFLETLEQLSLVLAIKGKVLPASLENLTLYAKLEDGKIIKGESEINGYYKHSHIINTNKLKNRAKISSLFTIPKAQALPIAIKAIKEADLIIIGPGSLYTSLIPNLLMKGMQEAIKSSKAKKVYVCNIMTQLGETNGYSALDHFKTMEKYLGQGVITHIILNNSSAPKYLLEKYGEEYQELIKPDIGKIKGVNIIKRNFIKANVLVRHDPKKLAETIIKIA